MSTIPNEDELEKLLNYLEGKDAYDGSWFGDTGNIGQTGKYWWRTKLRKFIQAYGDTRELEGRYSETDDWYEQALRNDKQYDIRAVGLDEIQTRRAELLALKDKTHE